MGSHSNFALAFVLASKRNTRFAFQSGSSAVIAFESGGGNVFIYHGSQRGDISAKQAILKVSGGAGGSLLGVGTLTTASGRVLLCLCEQEIVLIHDLF